MRSQTTPWKAVAVIGACVFLASCGGGHGSADQATSAAADTAQAAGRSARALSAGATDGATEAVATTQFEAVRLANQATFGPTEASVSEITSKGPVAWIADQFALSGSRYTSGGTGDVDIGVTGISYCARPPQDKNPNCWRDYYSAEPLDWDFYRNATAKPDQLRQRVALALQHILVISNVEVFGTYGFRYYYNTLLDNAFGNYRDVLKKVITSPMMGEYLNHVNNDKTAPNENFGRELLQLFSLGACKLHRNGELVTGKCTPTYNNDIVRNYAYAMTGWTYPKGGSTDWGCWPQGANCAYYNGDMVSAPLLRDGNARKLLSGVTVPAGSSAPQALELVLDSLMKHDNIGPFIALHMIQNLVMSNPRQGYVGRVARAFEGGTFTYDDGNGHQRTFGKGVPGDLTATVAAVLLDKEARTDAPIKPDAGFLREPALQFAGALRALNGKTDGATLGWWWGETLRQHVFRPPTVFDFYAPTYPVAGTGLVGPQFGIHNANGALERLNYLTYLIDWGGSAPDPNIPNAIGTQINLAPFTSSAADAGALVDRLSLLTIGRVLEPASRQPVIDAVSYWTDRNHPDDWRLQRASTAAYLVLGSPDYQVQR